MDELWRSLLLSLRIALAATALAALLAIPLASLLARVRFAGKAAVESLILVPLVLPPTVVGYLILMLLGARGWLGQWLAGASGYSIVFRFEGAVLAAAVVALPMLYLPAKAAFAGVEHDLEDAARVLGAGRWRTFWRVRLPLARRGVLSGLLLAFARALGEFGATVMVFGWQPGKQTLPISIYAHYEQGELSAATGAVVALLLISLSITAAYNTTSAAAQTKRH